jgi:Flp pilus assembly secretin CpaC
MQFRHGVGKARSTVVLFVMATFAPFGHASAGPQAVQTPQTQVQPGTGELLVVVKSQHRRLSFPQDIQRIAVGDTDILSAEVITSREVLVLGRETGRTTLIVWFLSGAWREYLFSVQRDLSVLEAALKRINPSIEVESAPDRDAIVLSGIVPDILASQTAEAVTRNYLDAGSTRRTAAQPLVAASAATTTPDTGVPAAPGAAGQATPPAPPAPTGAGGPGSSDLLRLQGTPPPSGTIINLLRLESLPPLPEQKIQQAIQDIGGANVVIRRMLHGNVRDDARDTLVLEGRVANQVALVRILATTAQLYAGQTITESDIHVVADEAGALAEQQPAQAQQPLLGGGATASLFGGNRSARLTNQVRRNLGRAKAVEAAGGRILSFIEVVDLPQIRVDIRLLEVNRARLRTFSPSSALLASDFRQPSLNPAQSAVVAQNGQAARVGSSGTAIQNVLSFLGGGLLNQLQFSGDRAAIDVAVSLLEREGIARNLSSPSLTVLSGELAQVQVGGEVPVPIAFAPGFGVSTGTTTTASVAAGVFNSVEFVPFGVQLEIRPLVGDDDSITLDVQPIVVTPDTTLTDTIRQTTGAAVPTTAFQTRALRTSSRLQDGQALLIGGLMSNSTSTNTTTAPGLADAPLLGRLFRSFNRNDESIELVVVVNPIVLRSPVPEIALWAFPDRQELMRSLTAGATSASRP